MFINEYIEINVPPMSMKQIAMGKETIQLGRALFTENTVTNAENK